MFPSPEFMATPEINYRRDRIAADLRGRKPARRGCTGAATTNRSPSRGGVTATPCERRRAPARKGAAPVGGSGNDGRRAGPPLHHHPARRP